MRRTHIVLAVLAALAVALIAGCGDGGGSTTPTTGSSSSSGAEVLIQEMAFQPSSVEIKAGDTVTWTNSDAVAHTVTGYGGIASDQLAQGDTYSKTFDTAGTYAYKCSIHPAMTGAVVVK